MTLTVTVRIDNIPGNTDGVSLQNTADLLFDDPSSPGSDLTVADPIEPTVTVSEPQLDLALDGPANMTLGASSSFLYRVLNSGSGPAFQPTLQIQLPANLNDTDPATLSTPVVTISSTSGGRNVTIPATSFTTSFTAGTPAVFEIAFTGADAFVATNEELQIQFDLTADNDTIDGSTATPIATVTALNSSDTSTAANPDNRVSSVVLASGTVGTANAGDAGDLPDDETDDHTVTIDAPVISFSKEVDFSSYDLSLIHI